MIALLRAKADGLWTRAHIRNNVLAGVVVGVVALPLAMAFAIASGARPEQGLYTAIVAAAMTSLFGGTRAQISGPTGAFVAVLAIITAQHGIAGLQIATLMAGMILLAFGFGRLGAVIKYIPNPVIAGFTAGIGVIIFVGLLAPVASDIPLCCLSAILFVVAWNMSEVRHFLRIIRGAPRPDVA
jgi:sulfate permease, SulP family